MEFYLKELLQYKLHADHYQMKEPRLLRNHSINQDTWRRKRACAYHTFMRAGACSTEHTHTLHTSGCRCLVRVRCQKTRNSGQRKVYGATSQSAVRGRPQRLFVCRRKALSRRASSAHTVCLINYGRE